MSVPPLHEPELSRVTKAVRDYYGKRISAHGATPWGVDWSSFITQDVRFIQLLKICNFSSSFSLNDAGCGYGALISYIAKYHPEADIDYLGFDISPAMIRHAMEVRWDLSRASVFVAGSSPRTADYSVASGIFNVKLDISLADWEQYIAKTLFDLSAASRWGFAVNFMAPDASHRRPGKHYWAMQEARIKFCETELGSSVEVLADYGLREFTLLARQRD